MVGDGGGSELCQRGPGVGLIHNPNIVPSSNLGGNGMNWLEYQRLAAGLGHFSRYKFGFELR